MQISFTAFLWKSFFSTGQWMCNGNNGIWSINMALILSLMNAQCNSLESKIKKKTARKRRRRRRRRRNKNHICKRQCNQWNVNDRSVRKSRKCDCTQWVGKRKINKQICKKITKKAHKLRTTCVSWCAYTVHCINAIKKQKNETYVWAHLNTLRYLHALTRIHYTLYVAHT